MSRKKKIKEEVDDIESGILDPITKTKHPTEFVSSGSITLNLALSGKVNGGWPLGDISNLIGDSDSGKSLLLLTMFVEAVYDPRFDKFENLYQAIETGLYFPLEQMFQDKLERIRILMKSPYTIQEWQVDTMKQLKTPSLIATDSWDALTSEDDLEAFKTGELKKGGYRTEKPLVASAILSPIQGMAQQNGSLILIVSQTRDNIGVSYGPAKRRAGGMALKFNSTCEVWLRKGEPIYKTIRGNKKVIGHVTYAKVMRSRITGKQREVSMRILDDFGVDNIGSCIDFLVKENFWSSDKNGKIDTCKDFSEEPMTTNRLIEMIDGDDENYYKLLGIMQESWDHIEEELSVNRKPRYARR